MTEDNIAQHNNPIAQSEVSSRNYEDVEKLCDDLTHWSYNYSINNPMQSVAIFHETIAMLRSLAKENAANIANAENCYKEWKALRANLGHQWGSEKLSPDELSRIIHDCEDD